MVLYALSLFICNFENGTADHFGHYEPSSPSWSDSQVGITVRRLIMLRRTFFHLFQRERGKRIDPADLPDPV